MSEKTSKQFSDPRLVAAYDVLNSLGEDRDFWVSELKRLGANSIIDFGCGTGLLTCDLAERGYEVYGVEPAEAMLDIAKSKRHEGILEWILGGYEKLPKIGADALLMTSHVAQFFLDDGEWRKALSAIYYSLKPGGYILFDSRTPIFPPYQSWPTVENPRRVESLSLGPIDWYYELVAVEGITVKYKLYFNFEDKNEIVVSNDELVFRSKDEIEESLESAGFEVEKVYGWWDGKEWDPKDEEMIFIARKV